MKKVNLITSICIVFLSLCTKISHSQITIIPTTTSTALNQIAKKGDSFYILGQHQYISMCDGDCDQVSDLTSPEPFGYWNEDLNVIDSNHFFLLSGVSFPHHYLVYKTNDGGQSWITVLDTTDFLMLDLIAFDTLNLFSPSTFYNNYTTGNGGESWSLNSNGLIMVAESHKLNDSTAIMSVNEKYGISFDKGITWTGQYFLQSNARAFDNRGPDTLVGASYGVSGIYFSYSFEHGLNNSWVDLALPEVEPFGITINSDAEVYIVGKRTSTGTGMIMKTEDFGLHWSYFDTEISGNLYDIKFVNDSTALVCGDNGLLFKWDVNTQMSYLSFESELPGTSINIYPNPSTDVINLILDDQKSTEVQIYSLDGILVKKVSIIESQIDVSDLAPGQYILSLFDDEHSQRAKFVKY